MPMRTHKVVGATPAGRADRELEVWIDPSGEEPRTHVWIHAPQADRSAGWEIRLDAQKLLAAVKAAVGDPSPRGG
jgi:hypothetical protein